MKALISISLIIGLSGSYMALRTAAWADMVAARYMVAHYEETRCNSYKIRNQEFDAVCGEVDELWSQYRESLKRYKKHDWINFIKNVFGDSHE